MPQDPAVSARAALYACVSSKEPEKDGFSIPAQQKQLRHYAAEKAIHVAQEFTDVETAKFKRLQPDWGKQCPTGVKVRKDGHHRDN